MSGFCGRRLAGSATKIARVEMPRLSFALGIPTSSETDSRTASLLTISPTVAGFVARPWICAPVGESGWPR
jgi:hypothetical protein